VILDARYWILDAMLNGRWLFYTSIEHQVSSIQYPVTSITHPVSGFSRRDAREAEGARLEIACPVNSGTVGSNPTLSASIFSIAVLILIIDSWVLRNENLQTPSGPEGSSGSKTFRVPQGSLAIIF
jgi:hypothetical protein